MAKKQQILLAAILLASLSACSAEPTESSYCALVSAKGQDVSEVISILDRYAEAKSLKRGIPSPNGILYSGPQKKYIINVTPVGPLGTEIAFFPRTLGTFTSEGKMLEEFVMDEVAKHFDVQSCGAVEGYGKGQIYGFENIAI